MYVSVFIRPAKMFKRRQKVSIWPVTKSQSDVCNKKIKLIEKEMLKQRPKSKYYIIKTNYLFFN